MEQPLVFISHRHADRKIADVIAAFVKETSHNELEVFQSSVAGKAPRPGHQLLPELARALARAGGLILVYTYSDEDWHWCMYECGLAQDPSSMDTRIVVFQCAEDAPSPLADYVKVDVSDEEEVHKFVHSWLTDADFIPTFGRAIAPRMDASGIRSVAKRLWEDLGKVRPRAEYEGLMFDYMRVELTDSAIQRIEAAFPGDSAAAIEIAKAEAVIAAPVEDYTRQLFNHRIRPRMRFANLVEVWQSRHPEAETAWVEDLMDQVVMTATDGWPEPQWRCLTATSRGKKYAPVVHGFRKPADENCTQFHVFFLPFALEAHVANLSPSATH